MNWMRFLAASQSFIGMKCRNSPYRVTHESWLHVVGAVCQPAAAGSSRLGAGGARSLAGRPEAVPLCQAPSDPPPAQESAKPSGSSTTKTLAGPVVMEGTDKLARPGGQEMVTRFSNANGVTFRRPVLAKTRRPLIQGELSLDTVKVVRNDLSDADLELVPGQVAAGPSAAQPGFAGLAFSRLAAGLGATARAQG